MGDVTTKMRIVQYLEFRGIQKKDFYQQTGIKRGFLDTNKMDGVVSDQNLAAIINVFDVSLEWLVTGRGDMTVGDNSNVIHGDNNTLRANNGNYAEQQSGTFGNVSGGNNFHFSDNGTGKKIIQPDRIEIQYEGTDSQTGHPDMQMLKLENQHLRLQLTAERELIATLYKHLEQKEKYILDLEKTSIPPKNS